jgi:hypothetical protein
MESASPSSITVLAVKGSEPPTATSLCPAALVQVMVPVFLKVMLTKAPVPASIVLGMVSETSVEAL